MIAIIYPHSDFTAAELATKAQVLAASQGHQVYAPPRNFMMTGYVESDVLASVRRASCAIFLAYDKPEIDGWSLRELAVARDAGVQTYFLIPASLHSQVGELGFADSVVHVYGWSDPDELLQVAQQIIADVEDRRRSPPVPAKTAKKKGAGEDLAALVGVLGILALLIYIFSKGKD